MPAALESPAASYATLVLAMLLPTGWELRAQDSAVSDDGRRVEMPAYSVRQLRGGGWKLERDTNHQAIRFSRTRKFLLSKVQVTTLMVMRDSSPEELWGLSPQELADSLRDNEVGMMTVDAALHGYQLKDIEVGLDTIAGKPLYSLRYQKVLLLPERWREDGILLLFFPEDFAAQHILYAFFMTDFYKSPSLGKPMGVKREPELINVLVSSLRIR